MKKESREFQNQTVQNSVLFFCGGDPEHREHLQFFNIYYRIEPDFMVRHDLTAEDFERDYRRVAGVWAWDKENAWVFMQGENWSPRGEARGLILDLGLRHTSMSVGDIIEDMETGEVWMVDFSGFKKIADKYVRPDEPDVCGGHGFYTFNPHDDAIYS